MRRTSFCLLVSLASVAAAASSGSAASPAGMSLPEGKDTVVQCDYFLPRDKKPLWHDESAAQGSYNYSVRIPAGYHENKRPYPCLFVMGGDRSSTFALPPRVEREGWLVLVMLGSAGGGGNPHGNLVAAYDDAMRRLRIRSSFLFAVGGRMAADAAGMRTDFRGMICSSADLSELFLNRTARNEKRRFAAYFPIGAGASTRDARGRESPPAVVEFAEKLAPRVSYRVGRSGGREATEEAFEWLERKVWLEAGTDRRRLDMYLWYYHSRMALCEAAETPLEKYGIISDMLAVVGKHQVRLDPEAKQRREELRRELEELESDPVLAHEIAARDLFLKVDALDDPAKYAPRRGRAAVTVQAVVASYEQVAGNYPGTVYAGKALARAKLLKEAWKLDKAR